MVRAMASWATWEIEQDASPSVITLAGLLTEKDPHIVQFACYLLGTVGRPAEPAAGRLSRLLWSDDPVLRLSAAEALMKITPAESRPVEVAMYELISGDQEIRCLAAVVLGTASPQHRTRVVELLSETLTDRDPTVRAATALSLGGLGPASSEVLDRLKSVAREDATPVQTAALTALACLQR